MPFVYDQSQIEWNDEENDPPEPETSQFEYIPPPLFGGAAEPVRFVVPSLDEVPAAPVMFNGGYSHNAAHDNHMMRLIAVVVPAMRELGARRAYCRYDGGNDEGFAWLDSVEMQDGTREDADPFIKRLSRLKLRDKIGKAPAMPGAVASEYEHIRDWLPNEWATMLLGLGYGTGEYSMYGAFTVDLAACTIVDDPNAERE